MISGKRLRQLRHETLKAGYPLDESLIEAAEANRAYHMTIINPITHLIYRYLTEFVARAAVEQTGRQPQDIKILDWGGGKGYVTYFLQQKGFDVVNFETGDFPHRDLWHKFKLPTATADGDKLPFKDQTFDAVVGFGVLEHVPYDYDALKEVGRVLKKDGLFFCFNLPNRLGYMHYVAHRRGIDYHDRLYGKGEIKQLLKRAGFNVLGKAWYRQVFPKNSIHYKHPRAVEKLDLGLSRYTPLKYLATSLEFVAYKQRAHNSEH